MKKRGGKGRQTQRRGGDRGRRVDNLQWQIIQEELNRNLPPLDAPTTENVIFEKSVLPPEVQREPVAEIVPLIESVENGKTDDALREISKLFDQHIPVETIVNGVIQGLRVPPPNKERK